MLFDSFPPVLQLQLKRFEYDFQRDMMVKVGGALCSKLQAICPGVPSIHCYHLLLVKAYPPSKQWQLCTATHDSVFIS